MGYSQAGVDSGARATDSNNSGNPACATGGTVASNVGKFGNNAILWWGRYFGPYSSYVGLTTMSMEPGTANINEAKAMRGIGVNRIAVLYSSQRPVIDQTKANGSADAQKLCDGITNVINDSQGNILMPGSGQVYVYLDVEANTNFAYAYWQGWSSTVNSYKLSNGASPYFACCYCDPNDKPVSGQTHSDPCSILNNAPCYGVWSSEPEPGPCSVVGPAWNPAACASVYTLLWQYLEQPCCGTSSPYVDKDESTPGTDMMPTMLYLP